MVQPNSLDPRQREFILDWIGEQKDPVTYDDLAHRCGVHYQTARTWIIMLEHEGLLTEYPIRQGNRKRFMISKSQPEEAGRVVRGPMMIARGTEQMTFMDWAARNLNNTFIAQVAHGMIYLYVRSYFANSPDHQHLRGVKVPVEVRTMILEWVDQAKRDLGAIQQMLSYQGAWHEGGELAERFGPLPVGIEMSEVIQKAAFFHQQVTPDSERKNELPMPSPSPPEPEVRTLGDTLREMGVNEAPPTGEVMPPAVEPVESEHPKTLGEVFELQRLKEQNPGLHIVEVDE